MASESVKVKCPDCGGIIGEVGSGEKPCTCGQSSTRQGAQSDEAYAAGVAKGVKFCIACGKDVAGRRRIKDSRGYTCYDCAKAEREKELVGTIPCAECGRRIREQGILDWNGTQLCRRCYQQHKESSRQKFRQIAKTSSYARHEKGSLLRLSLIAGVFLLIILWRLLR